jgi:hypothetical protein
VGVLPNEAVKQTKNTDNLRFRASTETPGFSWIISRGPVILLRLNAENNYQGVGTIDKIRLLFILVLYVDVAWFATLANSTCVATLESIQRH